MPTRPHSYPSCGRVWHPVESGWGRGRGVGVVEDSALPGPPKALSLPTNSFLPVTLSALTWCSATRHWCSGRAAFAIASRQASTHLPSFGFRASGKEKHSWISSRRGVLNLARSAHRVTGHVLDPRQTPTLCRAQCLRHPASLWPRQQPLPPLQMLVRGSVP